MKKHIIMGMVLVSISGVSFQAYAQRAGAAAARVTAQTRLTEHLREVKAQVFGAGRVSARGLSAQARDFATSQRVQELPIDAAVRQGLVQALTVTRSNRAEMVEANFESLVVIVGTRQLARQLESQPEMAAEAASLTRAADAATRALSDSILVGSRQEVPNFLNRTEMAEVVSALRKESSIIEAIMKMETAERDSWSQIIEARTRLVRERALSPEEAYVRAIMEVKNVNREQALEVLRKIKDCV